MKQVTLFPCGQWWGFNLFTNVDSTYREAKSIIQGNSIQTKNENVAFCLTQAFYSSWIFCSRNLNVNIHLITDEPYYCLTYTTDPNHRDIFNFHFLHRILGLCLQDLWMHKCKWAKYPTNREICRHSTFTRPSSDDFSANDFFRKMKKGRLKPNIVHSWTIFHAF